MTDVPFESPRRTLIRRVITTLVIIACIGLLVVAAQRTERGDKDEPKFGSDSSETEIVELRAPRDGENVLAQAQILIDLNFKYDAGLSVNNVEIPTDQLQKSRELATVAFTPGPGKVFERLPQGRVCATANIFRVDGTQEDPRTETWCFNVT